MLQKARMCRMYRPFAGRSALTGLALVRERAVGTSPKELSDVTTPAWGAMQLL
jgi:hypothetical protein